GGRLTLFSHVPQSKRRPENCYGRNLISTRMSNSYIEGVIRMTMCLEIEGPRGRKVRPKPDSSRTSEGGRWARTVRDSGAPRDNCREIDECIHGHRLLNQCHDNDITFGMMCGLGTHRHSCPKRLVHR